MLLLTRGRVDDDAKIRAAAAEAGNDPAAFSAGHNATPRTEPGGEGARDPRIQELQADLARLRASKSG